MFAPRANPSQWFNTLGTFLSPSSGAIGSFQGIQNVIQTKFENVGECYKKKIRQVDRLYLQQKYFRRLYFLVFNGKGDLNRYEFSIEKSIETNL